MILALDTSTERLCLALAGEGVFSCLDEPGGPMASKRLLPAAKALLLAHGLRWQDLQAVAVAVGPGAFTGLRTACSAAQGLALGLDLPVLPVGSLEVVAQEAWDALDSGEQGAGGALAEGSAADSTLPRVVRVAVDARMGQVYAAAYVCGASGAWVATPGQGPSVGDPAEVAAQWWPPHPDAGRVPSPAWRSEIWAGSGLALLPSQTLDAARAAGMRLQAQSAHRARALGRLALKAWATRAVVDAAQLVPMYVRDRVALTTAERLAGAH